MSIHRYDTLHPAVALSLFMSATNLMAHTTNICNTCMICVFPLVLLELRSQMSQILLETQRSCKVGEQMLR